jgi:hypothetical protein
VAVIHLVAVRHAAGLGIAGVIEATRVRQPGQAGGTRERNLVGRQMLVGVDVQHAQGAQFGAAL